MPNFIDYLKWRGDITFDVSPFNAVDNLIFSQLCFVDFSNIVSENPCEAMPLHMAARKTLARMGPKSKKLGFMIPSEILDLLELLAQTPRYRDISLCAYHSETDTEEEYQFAAISALISKDNLVVTFRGTDDTLVGWKEDFNMVLFPNVPSQKMAVEYLEGIHKAYPEKNIYVCGHSKGGNLAIYSSTMVSDQTQASIVGVYNNDGPGFNKEFFEKEEYLSLKDRMHTIIPQSSFVGLMFEQDEDSLSVVKSTAFGAFQHDVFSWQVMGPALEGASLTKETLKDKKAFNAWVEEMKYEDRKDAVNILFDFLASTGATTLTEAFNNSPKLIRAYRELPEEKRKIVSTSLKIFFHERIKNMIEPITPLFKNLNNRVQTKKNNDEENIE